MTMKETVIGTRTATAETGTVFETIGTGMTEEETIETTDGDPILESVVLLALRLHLGKNLLPRN